MKVVDHLRSAPDPLDARQVQGVLADAGLSRGEVYVLTLCVKAGVVSRLLAEKQLPAALSHPRFYHLLVDDFFVVYEKAAWAVETWAEALGLEVLPLPQAQRTVVKPAPAPAQTSQAPVPPPANPGGRHAFIVTRTATEIQVDIRSDATAVEVREQVKRNPADLAGLPVVVVGDGNPPALAAFAYHAKAVARSITVKEEVL